MPIKIGDREFEKFRQAEAYIRRTKPGVEDPAAYVASIEHKQKDKPKYTAKEYPPKYTVYKRKRKKN